MILRDILYLDRPLVRTFLAQLEGGNVDELTEREQKTGKGALGGRLGTSGLGVQGEKSDEHSIETQAVLRQVASSELDRLISYLQDDDLTVVTDVNGEDDFAKIKRMQFVEIDARVRVSGLQQVQDLIATIADLMPAMAKLGATFDADPVGMDKMKAFGALAPKGSRSPIIAVVPGDAGFRVGLELDPIHAAIQSWDVDATVLLKVQRVLKDGEKQVVGRPLGGLFDLLPPDKAEEFGDKLNAPVLQSMGVEGELSVGYPGLIGTAVAIYR